MAISRKYDDLFRRLAPSIPVAYMRALAYKESRMNPKAQAPGGGTGLLQITGIALKDFNQNNSKSYSRSQMYQVGPNIEVAGWLLRRIINGYKKSPSRNLREDWNNPEFVKLLTAGWNSGWVGVLKVDRWLRGRGLTTTHLKVFQYAKAAGATEHLQHAQKRSWQAQVASTFYDEGGRSPSPRDPLDLGPVVAGISTPRAALAVGLSAALGYGAWQYFRR